jgi:polysaccharide biosynthesis/export protein
LQHLIIFQGNLMKWGRRVFTRQGSSVLCILISFLSTCSIAYAQQKPAESRSTESAVPAPPPAQSISDAAASTAKGSSTQPNSTSAAAGLKLNAAEPDSNQDASLLRLGPGDLIELNVYNVPELATKARVGTTGDVYLPLIDYVHLAGLTVEEAQTLLEKRLTDGGFVRNPHVTIFVDESPSQGVTLLGEVGKPGIYPVLGDRKLYDVISEAGGFTPTAARKVSIIRHNPPQATTLNLPRNLADDLQNNVEVMPGDTITVPRAPIIYVVGDVGRPSGLLVDNGSLTVLQAIAMAGGTNKTAKMNGVRIIRKGPAGMSETHVPLKKMLEAKAPDVPLQGDDILFVPVSGGKVLASRTFEAAMSAATAVTIYTVHP